MDWVKKNWLLVVTLAVALSGWAMHLYNRAPDYAGKVEIATPAKEVANAPKIDVPVKSVKVYAGGAKTKRALTLPKPVVDDDRQQVIASSKIAASDRPHTVTTVINADSGASETYVRTDPLPWLAYTSRGSAGVYYGMKNGEQAIRLQVTQNIVQVKAVHIGATASVDRTMVTGKTDGFVGVGASYAW